jgi:hypothetical protein
MCELRLKLTLYSLIGGKSVAKKERKLSYDERLALFNGNAEYRKKLFKGLCKHLSEGYSMDCYKGMSLTAIKEAIKKYPSEFDERELIEAEGEGKNWWESIGRQQANGSCMGNSRTWYYNMAHRYKWSDRQTIDANINGQVSVNVINYAKPTPSHIDEDADNT